MIDRGTVGSDEGFEVIYRLVGKTSQYRSQESRFIS